MHQLIFLSCRIAQSAAQRWTAQKGAKTSVFNSKANGGQADDNAENELKERAKDNDRN